MKQTDKTVNALNGIKRWLWNNADKKRGLGAGRPVDEIIIDRKTFDMLFDEAIKNALKEV